MNLIPWIRNQSKELQTIVSEMMQVRLFRIATPIAVLCVFATALIPWIFLYPQVAERVAIPLHYNIHFGVDLFGAPWRVYTAAITGAVFFVVNYMAAILLWKRRRVLSYGFVSATMVIEGVFLLGSIFTTLLVLSYL